MQKAFRILGYFIFTITLGLTVLYISLLGMQAYSQHQASVVLDRLEALRVGDPEVKFEDAVKGISATRNQFGEVLYTLTSGSYRSRSLQRFAGTMPPWLWRLSNGLGLRYWRLDITSHAENNQIKDVWVSSYLVGRYEALGAEWQIAPTVGPSLERLVRQANEHRTFLHWYHLMSRPSGEGFSIHVTPASTEKELLARQINRRCLLSFRGCDGLCELLPHAIPVLVDRHQDWGGGTCVPRSHCDFNNKWIPRCDEPTGPTAPANH